MMLSHSARWLCLACWLLVGSAVQAQIAGNANWQATAQYPHPSHAFTQGLSYVNGELIETTGKRGLSRVLRYVPGELPDGAIATLPRQYFGEGSVVIDDQLLWLSWQRGQAFWVDLSTGSRSTAFRYDHEGWGLALSPNKTELAVSDGTDVIRVWNHEGEVLRTISVRQGEYSWHYLNELEWIGNTIFAFVWMNEKLLAIDADSGEVKQIYDLAPLRDIQSEQQRITRHHTLNGIAYDPEDGQFFVTGKNWSTLYKLELEGWE
ncbi:MAG: glutaminyl-peptide cyclotransferase [Pseudomonadales bacterium]|jgi:glutamine cyclotransferase